MAATGQVDGQGSPRGDIASRWGGAGQWEWDLVTGALRWSAELFELFGLDGAAEAADFETWRRILHPDDRQDVEEGLRAAIREGRWAESQYRVVLPSGLTRWVHAVAQAIRDEAGRCVRMAGLCVDVSGQRRTRAILEARLRLMAFADEHSLEELLVATLDEAEALTGSCVGFYHFVEADERHLSLQAWSSNTVGRMCRARGTGLHYNTDEAGVWVDCLRLRRATIHNDYASLPHRKGLPPGHAPIVRELVVPVFRADRIVAILGVGNKPRDYTEEDVDCVVQLADLAWDIAHRMRVEEQLRGAQKLEALGLLAGGVAHEFRNQLQVIQGHAEMLRRRGLVGADGQAMVDAIVGAVARSAGITGELLAFGRREILRPRTHSLRDCVADVGRVLPGLIGEEIRLEVRSGGEACLADVDEGLFRQAVLNLVVNARDAMPRGGTLTLKTGVEPLGPSALPGDPDLPAGPYAVVTVGDTGVGMDPATLARVFDPFFTTKEMGKGTGLGLAMVYGFVKQSGGGVDIRSKPGEGTTVRLLFPRAACPSPSPAPTAGRPAASSAERGTVLVVEDEPALVALVAALLKEEGYRVLTAPGPREALALAGPFGEPIDLLVTDVVMPQLSGVALAEQLKAARPELAVLYMSGYSGQELLGRGLPPSAECLSKPFRDEDLLAHVRRLLGSRPAGNVG